MQAMSEEVAASVVNSDIQRHLQAAAHGVFARPVLRQALAYAKQVPMQFLQVVLPAQVSCCPHPSSQQLWHLHAQSLQISLLLAGVSPN